MRSRLAAEPELRKVHDNIANTLRAASLASQQQEPPDDLVERTLRRIAAHKRTEALIARQAAGVNAHVPTFSLREFAALAAAAVILAAVVIPAFMEGRARTMTGKCAANVGQIGYALQAYASENGGHLPMASSDTAAWLPGTGEPAKSNSAALFKLVVRHANPVSFQCPAVGGGTFVVRPGMTDFPGQPYISYSYQHAIGAANLRRDDLRLRGVLEHMAILADNTPLFQNGQFRRDRLNVAGSENHNATGQNVLYLDSHVDWHDGARVGVNGDHIFMAGNLQQYRGDETPTGPEDTFLLPAYSAGQASR
jgi:hypothetical protein